MTHKHTYPTHFLHFNIIVLLILLLCVIFFGRSLNISLRISKKGLRCHIVKSLTGNSNRLTIFRKWMTADEGYCCIVCFPFALARSRTKTACSWWRYVCCVHRSHVDVNWLHKFMQYVYELRVAVSIWQKFTVQIRRYCVLLRNPVDEGDFEN